MNLQTKIEAFLKKHEALVEEWPVIMLVVILFGHLIYTICNGDAAAIL